MYPDDYLYTEDHEWIKVDEGTCTLGVTEFAQKELGEIVFVELPEVGQVFDAHDEIGTIESVKAVAEVFTPVAGEISEINDAVVEEPELVNDEPHGDGWLVKLEISSSSDLEGLMSAADYGKFVEEQE